MSEDCVALAQNGAVSTPAGSRLNRRRTYGLILEKRTPCAPAPGDVLIPVRARGGVFLRDREAGAFRRAAPNSSEDTIPPTVPQNLPLAVLVLSGCRFGQAHVEPRTCIHFPPGVRVD